MKHVKYKNYVKSIPMIKSNWIEKNIILISTLTSSLIFSIFVTFTSFPIQADDYASLVIANQRPQLSVLDFPELFPRMPISILLGLPILSYRIWEIHPKIFFIFFFSIHALAVGHLIHYFLSKLFSSQILKNSNSSLFFILIITLFSLHPNNYEIHLWHGIATHSLGAFFVAFSFTSRKNIFRIFGSTAGCLVYDTFPLLLIGLCCLDGMISILKKKNQSIGVEVFKKNIFLFVGALSLSSLIKLALLRFTGTIHNPGFHFLSSHSWQGIYYVLKTTLLIHFYKINWALSLIELSIMSIAMAITIHLKLFNKIFTGTLGLLTFLAALPLALMTYPAQRAFYGPNIIKIIVFSIFIYCLIAFKKYSRLGFIFCFILLLAYLTQWGVICRIKQSNWKAITQTQKHLSLVLAQCQSPCVIRVPPPTQGINRDWVVPQMFWHSFYEWAKLKAAPEKQVEIQIVEKGYDPEFDQPQG